MTRTPLAAILAIALLATSARADVALHSLPGATYTAVLDFGGVDGGNSANTVAAWGDDALQHAVWQIVANAANHPTYRLLDGTITHPLGFDVDVTTVDSGRRDGTVAICHVGDIAGLQLGGYAYLGGMRSGSADCYVATNNLAESPSIVGVATAHELLGHDMMDLYHQVDVDPTTGLATDEYQYGDAIMGVAYYSATPLWQQGYTSYAGAGTTAVMQDDYAIGVSQLGTAATPEPASLAIILLLLQVFRSHARVRVARTNVRPNANFRARTST